MELTGAVAGWDFECLKNAAEAVAGGFVLFLFLCFCFCLLFFFFFFFMVFYFVFNHFFSFIFLTVYPGRHFEEFRR